MQEGSPIYKVFFEMCKFKFRYVKVSHGSRKKKNSLRVSKKSGNFHLAQKLGKSQEILKKNESGYLKNMCQNFRKFRHFESIQAQNEEFLVGLFCKQNFISN